MLVLNTNEWNENALWRMSNKEFLSYPDFEQILLMPPWMISWHTQTDWTISVYWIPIHAYCSDIYQAQYNNWTIWTSADIWWLAWVAWATTTPSTAWTVYWRFASNFKLKWWEIIWKSIIWTCSLNSTSSFTWQSWNMSAIIKFYLIHSDWTMSTIWTSDTITRSTRATAQIYSNSVEYWWHKHRSFNISTSWIVAQEWDVLMFEIEFQHSVSSYTWNSTTSYQMTFWSAWWWSWPETIATPIQISIE